MLVDEADSVVVVVVTSLGGSESDAACDAGTLDSVVVVVMPLGIGSVVVEVTTSLEVSRG